MLASQKLWASRTRSASAHVLGTGPRPTARFKEPGPLGP